MHVHILPRKKGDYLNNDDIYNDLRDWKLDSQRPARTAEEMATEATMLRSHLEE